jgi:hypothetical protein
VKRDQELYEEMRAEEADAAAATNSNGSSSSNGGGGSYGRYDGGGAVEAQQYSLMQQGQGSESAGKESPVGRWGLRD